MTALNLEHIAVSGLRIIARNLGVDPGLLSRDQLVTAIGQARGLSAPPVGFLSKGAPVAQLAPAPPLPFINLPPPRAFPTEEPARPKRWSAYKSTFLNYLCASGIPEYEPRALAIFVHVAGEDVSRIASQAPESGAQSLPDLWALLDQRWAKILQSTCATRQRRF